MAEKPIWASGALRLYDGQFYHGWDRWPFHICFDHLWEFFNLPQTPPALIWLNVYSHYRRDRIKVEPLRRRGRCSDMYLDGHFVWVSQGVDKIATRISARHGISHAWMELWFKR